MIQGGAKCLLALGYRDVEKSRTDFRREAHENSKNKAVPRKRLQHEKAAQLRGKKLERVGIIRRFRSLPKSGPNGFNQEAAMR